jgi:hypothetical protein
MRKRPKIILQLAHTSKASLRSLKCAAARTSYARARLAKSWSLPSDCTIISSHLPCPLEANCCSYYISYAILENQPIPEQYDAPPKLRTEAVSFVDEPHYCFSPILRSPSCDDADYDLRHPQAVLPFLQELNAGWELLFLEYHSSPESIDYLTYSAYRAALQMPQEPIAHTTGRVQDDVIAAKLARTSYLAGLIFYRAIVSLTPFSDPVNEKDVTELHVLMKGMDPSIWTLTPYILIWM